MTDKMKVTRRRLTVADKLKAVDELHEREAARLDKKVADAKAVFEAAVAEREARRAALDTKRESIIRAAEAQMAALKAQIEQA